MHSAPLATHDRKAFLLGGNATLTLVSTRTGQRFTYRVRACKDNASLYFVHVLTGSDNTSDYSYLGTLRTSGSGDAAVLAYSHGRKSRIAPDASSALAFAWFVVHLTSADVEMWHEGRCGRCNRVLTVPESLARGLGPECADAMMTGAV